MAIIIRSEDARVVHTARPRPSRRVAPAVETALVFDAVLVGSTGGYTSEDHELLLGGAERLAIHLIADEVTGTSPTVTVRVQHSPTGQNWDQKNTSAEISSASIPAGAVTDVFGSDDGTRPGAALGRLEVVLGGTNPKAHVRIWATARPLA